jgi:hypothetical protein
MIGVLLMRCGRYWLICFELIAVSVVVLERLIEDAWPRLLFGSFMLLPLCGG